MSEEQEAASTMEQKSLPGDEENLGEDDMVEDDEELRMENPQVPISARNNMNLSFSEELELRLETNYASRSISLLDQIAHEEQEKEKRRNKQNLLLTQAGMGMDDIIARELDAEIEELSSLSSQLANARLCAPTLDDDNEGFDYEKFLGKSDKVFTNDSSVTISGQQREAMTEDTFEKKRSIGSAHHKSTRSSNGMHSGTSAFLEQCDNFSHFNFPVLSIIDKFNHSTLDLSHLTLGDKGLQAISSMLSLNNVIKKLILIDNNVTAVGFFGLVSALKKNKTVKYVDMSDNKIGIHHQTLNMDVVDMKPSQNLNSTLTTAEIVDKCGEALEELLKKNVTMETLILKNNNLSDVQLRHIQEGLTENVSINYLDISCNDFSDMSAPCLSSLASNIHLTHLDLSWTSLRTHGINSLLSGLKTNNTLQHLNIEWIGLNNDHCKMLAGFIAESSFISYLNISHNRFNEEGLEAISKAVEQNTSLTHLDLSYNALGNGAVLNLFRSLYRNKGHTIKHLNLKETQIFVIIDSSGSDDTQPCFMEEPVAPSKKGQKSDAPTTGDSEDGAGMQKKLGKDMFVSLRYLTRQGTNNMELILSKDVDRAVTKLLQ